MKTKIEVDNLKCGGCSATIENGLKALPQLNDVMVDVEHGTVEVEYGSTEVLEKIRRKLKSLGYPEKGTTKGMVKLAAGARSYVSCAIGKVSENRKRRLTEK